jgi:hypothetical protein
MPVAGKLLTVPIGVGHEVNTNADKTMTDAGTAKRRNGAPITLLDIEKLLLPSAIEDAGAYTTALTSTR